MTDRTEATRREILELACRLDKYAEGCEKLADEISQPPHQPRRLRPFKSQYDAMRENTGSHRVIAVK